MMKHILAGFILMTLVFPVMAENSSQQPVPTPTPATQPQSDKTKIDSAKTKESIVDFCRTHTC